MVSSSFSFNIGDRVIILNPSLGVCGRSAIVESRKVLEGFASATYGVRVDGVYCVVEERNLMSVRNVKVA